jgi:pyridoxal-dependent decarboxylase-like protein
MAACSSRATLGDLACLPLLMNAPCLHCEQIRTRGSDAALAAPICPQCGQTIRVSMRVTTAAAGNRATTSEVFHCSAPAVAIAFTSPSCRRSGVPISQAGDLRLQNGHGVADCRRGHGALLQPLRDRRSVRLTGGRGRSLQRAATALPSWPRREPRIIADIVGPVCESGDFLSLDRSLVAPQARRSLAMSRARLRRGTGENLQQPLR